MPILDPTLRSHFDVLYRVHRLAGKSLDTVRLYHVELNNFAAFLGREATLDDLTDETVLGVMDWQIRRGRTPETANCFRAKIVSLWRFLHNKGLTRCGPDVLRFIEPAHTPVAWTAEQLHRLWQACDALPGFVSGIPASNWWHGLHAVIWDTGERIGAVTALEWATVDLDSRWVRFPAKIRKGKKRDATFRLHEDTAAFLLKMQRPRGKVFPWTLRHTTLWLHYTRLLKRNGLPYDRRHKFHCLRRSVASYFEAAGGNATALLGHSSRRITEASYIDPRIASPPQASDYLFRPDSQPPLGQ